MGSRGNRDVSKTHSLFVDDLKVYQESHEILRDVKEVIVQASHDTGACYVVSKSYSNVERWSRENGYKF